MTSMDEYHRKPGSVITDEQRLIYAGIYVLKLLDLEPEDGGMDIPVILPSELAPLEEVMQKLLFDDLIAIDRRSQNYNLTKKGIAYIGELIDEAEALVDEFDDEELEDTVRELQARNLDVFRARFLWGWYEGEFDDLILFQQRRGISPVEEFWAYYLMDDAFYSELARDMDPDAN